MSKIISTSQAPSTLVASLGPRSLTGSLLDMDILTDTARVPTTSGGDFVLASNSTTVTTSLKPESTSVTTTGVMSVGHSQVGHNETTVAENKARAASAGGVLAVLGLLL